MIKNEDRGAVVKTYSGQGQITFPLGGKISSYFTLAEYGSGERLLTCTGRFTKASYSGWEQLVSRYQIEPSEPGSRKEGLAGRFEGQTDDKIRLKIQRMFLIASQASAVGPDNLTLEMRFDPQDVSLLPAAE